jgi:hypothetical protein
MERWRHGVAFGAVHGRCRVHRAELLRITGPASAAEEEALGACADLRPWMRREFGWPLVELGNIRLRRGDLAGAEESFMEAHASAWSPQPGLALLRMRQGELDAAAELVAVEIDSPTPLPWKERPPIADLQLVPLLEAQVEIAFAARDASVADDAARRLRSIANRHETSGLRASADLASARAAVLAGDPATAVASAAAALATWVELDAPYDAAMAHVVLGHAHRSAGNPDMATLEWRSAQACFETYGAPLHLADVDALLGTVHGDTRMEFEVQRGDTVFGVPVELAAPAVGAPTVTPLYHLDPARSRAAWSDAPLGGPRGALLVSRPDGGPMRRVPIGTVIVRQGDTPVLSGSGLVRQLASLPTSSEVTLHGVEAGGDEHEYAVRLLGEGRVVTRASLPVLFTYDADLEADRRNLVVLDLWIISLFRYARDGNERRWRVLRFFEWSSGVGELGE